MFAFFAVLAGAALVLSAEKTTKESEPIIRNSPNLYPLFRVPNLWFVFGYIFATYGAISFYLFRLPLRLTDVGFGAETIGIVLAAIWFSFAVASTLMRNWVDSVHIRKIVLAAPVLIAASFSVAYLSNHLALLIISAVLIGAAFACSNAPSTQLVLKFAPENLSAMAVSLDITFARLGGVATVTLLAQLDFGQSLKVVVGLSIVAAACALVCLRKIR